jgi:hypothetical protein
MFKKIKFALWLHKMYNRILKIKLVKALSGVITVLLSYSLIRYFIYFNKLIIWLIGLIFVGVNWSDYHLIKELKLIFDSIKLFILGYFPVNEMTEEIKDNTRNDIKEIIKKDSSDINYKDHTNLNDDVDKDYVYVIADKLNEIKSVRVELKESYITDGKDKIWTFSDIFNYPWTIFLIATAITISGIIIINIYDPNLETTKTYIVEHIKASFSAIVLFLGKIIKIFKGGSPRPPINPSDDGVDINPALILDKGKGPMVLPSDPSSSNLPSSDNPIIGCEKPPFFDIVQADPILKAKQEIHNKILYTTANLKELTDGEATSESIQKSRFLINKLEEFRIQYEKLDAEDDARFSSGSLTPTIKSPVNTDNIALPNILDD